MTCYNRINEEDELSPQCGEDGALCFDCLDREADAWIATADLQAHRMALGAFQKALVAYWCRKDTLGGAQ